MGGGRFATRVVHGPHTHGNEEFDPQIFPKIITFPNKIKTRELLLLLLILLLLLGVPLTLFRMIMSKVAPPLHITWFLGNLQKAKNGNKLDNTQSHQKNGKA